MSKAREFIPGLLLCFTLAGLGAWGGARLPLIGSVVFALGGGIALRGLFSLGEKNGVRRQMLLTCLTPGIALAGKTLLQLAIVLLGFQISLTSVFAIGGDSLLVLLATISASFAAGTFFSRRLKLVGNTPILIAIGTSICGGSAIAAAAPVLQAEDAEIANAISTIFLFNILAVFLFPWLGHLLGLSDGGFGVWAGTAINDTSSVVAAGAAWSQAAGNGMALTTATIVKLTRTLMIIPVCFALAFVTSRREASEGERVKLGQIVPWFVFLFLGAATSTIYLPLPLAVALGEAGKFLIVVAMAAIGFKTDLPTLLRRGPRPFILGLCCWGAVALSSLVVQSLLGMW